MQSIDNHWNYGEAFRRETGTAQSEPEIPRWTELEWEQVDLIDFDPDERMYNYIMTAECNGVKYEGTGVYVCGELEIVENIEIVN